MSAEAAIPCMGGAIGGGGGGGGVRGAMAPPIIWLGAIMYLAPQYFALEFKILTLGLMQREENMYKRIREYKSNTVVRYNRP